MRKGSPLNLMTATTPPERNGPQQQKRYGQESGGRAGAGKRRSCGLQGGKNIRPDKGLQALQAVRAVWGSSRAFLRVSWPMVAVAVGPGPRLMTGSS